MAVYCGHLPVARNADRIAVRSRRRDAQRRVGQGYASLNSAPSTCAGPLASSCAQSSNRPPSHCSTIWIARSCEMVPEATCQWGEVAEVTLIC